MELNNEVLLNSPEKSPSSNGHLNNRLTSLDPKAKQTLFSQIQKFESNLLEKALIAAALNQCKFPNPLDQKLKHLQSAYLEHQDNESVMQLIKQAIVTYIQSEGLLQFQSLQKEPFIEDNWKSSFLTFLAKHLNIKIEEEPLVEAAIQEGKIYWRIVKGHEVLYDRQEAKEKKFKFEQEKSWLMSWEQFRLFKDSGKRSGTIAITKERFISNFNQNSQFQAIDVWEELKQLGILNAHNRLSNGWRAITNVWIELTALSAITETKIIDCLNSFKENDGCKPITRDAFVAWWPHGHKYRAGLIWDVIKKQQAFDAQQNLKIQISDFLKYSYLSYDQVVKALYLTVNTKEHQEILKELPDGVIYRQERSLKKWASTGRVENKTPKEKEYCTKLWDVSIHNDLDLHRNTSDEELLNQNQRLNYDHTPSTDIQKKMCSSYKNDYETKIKLHQESIQKIEEEIKTQKRTLLQDNIYLTRRQEEKITPNHDIQQLEKKRAEIQKTMEEIQSRQQQIVFESKGHGPYWWTVAIPEKFHRQGETFLQSSKDQQKSTEHPFLKDLRTYLYILESRPEDFGFNQDDYVKVYLKALGAFRYLYHCQTKPSIAVAGNYPIGTISQTLFSKSEDKKIIDKLFEEKIKNFLAKKEGFKYQEEEKSKLLPKMLGFNKT